MINTDFVRQLSEKEADHLFFFIRKMVEDGELAEDILQETFCIAMRRADELRKHPRPVAWLYMTAKYVILSECRKKQKRDLNYCYEDMEDLIRDPYAETAMLSMEEDAVKALLETADADLCEIITLFVGKAVSDQRRAALTEELEEAYPDCEIVVYEGGQDVYDYYLAVE